MDFDPENPNYVYIDTKDKLEEMYKALENEKMLGVDTETTGLDPYTCELLLFQIGNKEISYVIDGRRLNLKKEQRLIEILEDPKVIKILQNAKFDYKIIKVHIGAELKNIYDTMLAEGVLTAGTGQRTGLKVLADKYLGIELDKVIRDEFLGMKGEITEDHLKYAANDTLILFPIVDKQLPLLQKAGISKIAKLEFAATIVVAEMELYGLNLDVKRWRKIISELEKKRDAVAKEFYTQIKEYYPSSQVDLFGDTVPPININSNTQLLDLFNNKLNINISSTGDAVLAGLDHPLAKTLRNYRGYEKLISSFGDTLLQKVNPVTKRLHPDFNQIGAATGRFSCREPNLQQIPRNSEEAPFRECFNPKEGYKLVVSDYSSFEMRILADLSGDENMVKAFKEGLDMHSFTASMMFNKEYTDDFKKHYPELRQAAKAIGFGLMYGMGSMGLARRLDIDDKTAEEYMTKYFNSFPSVKKFLDGLANTAVNKGFSTTPAGRKRFYKQPDKTDPDYNRKISSIKRQAKNHPIQGTNADAVKYALVYVHERLKKEGIDGGIILTVHDEIVCEVVEDKAEYVGKLLSEEMVRAAELFITKVPVISEPFVGDVWEH